MSHAINQESSHRIRFNWGYHDGSRDWDHGASYAPDGASGESRFGGAYRHGYMVGWMDAKQGHADKTGDVAFTDAVLRGETEDWS